MQNHQAGPPANGQNRYIPRKGSVPLFKKIEVDFKKKEKDILIERKETLAALRDFKRKEDITEINNHQVNYDLYRLNKKKEIEANR